MAEQLVLRDYQLDAVEQLRRHAREHRRQILMAPCGAGKTVIGAHLLAEAYRKGSPAAFLVDRIPLVGQTSATLARYGIPHGIIQADNTCRSYERIQVCSAQTLERRGFVPDLKLLIVDEAHAMRRETLELMAARPELVVLGLTATPFTRGLGLHYSNLINVITTDRLIELGMLVPLKMYAARQIDMTGAKIVAGEWSEADIEARGIAIVGDIVNEWCNKTLLHFGRPVKTIVFSATVAHGEELCRQFNAAGFNFQQISYKDNNAARRDALIDEFRKPDSAIDGLVSCEVFTKGFDVPDVLCVITARPYRKSFSSHIQQLGRGMRIADGKTYCLLLDHAGNIVRFMDDMVDLFAHGLDRLDARSELDRAARAEPDDEVRLAKTCSCGYVFALPLPTCPACGKVQARRLSLVENMPGVMQEVRTGKSKVDKHAYLADRLSVWRQLVFHCMLEKKGDAELARRMAQSIYLKLYGEFARHKFDPADGIAPCQQLLGKLKSMRLAWIHAQKKAALRGVAHG